jgi:CheY-like chemotaxis protein
MMGAIPAIDAQGIQRQGTSLMGTPLMATPLMATSLWDSAPPRSASPLPPAPAPSAKPEPGQPVQTKPLLSDVAAAKKRHVLVVDDDQAVRETLSELLELAGFMTTQAPHAAIALDALRQDPDIAAIVTDLTMPGDDGIALIRLARTVRCGIPAILLTGYAEEITSVATIAGGNFHVLRKPVESDRLIDQLDLLLAAGPAA